MKNIILFCLTAFTLFSFKSDDPIQEYLNVPGPLNFDGKSFDLNWTSKNDNYYIQEYLTANDSIGNFKEMISLFVLNESVSIDDAVNIKIQELDEFKKTDPVCNYALTTGSKKSEYIVDFLRGESIGEIMTLVEFNIYRYKQIKIGKNKKAVLVYAFSKRASGYDIIPFLKSLKVERLKYIEKIQAIELPEINLTKIDE